MIKKLIKNKKALIIALLLITVLITSVFFINFINLKKTEMPTTQMKHNRPDFIDAKVLSMEEFRNGLKEIKLVDSVFADVLELYDLRGKTREEIEKKYKYSKIISANTDFATYYLDKCTVIYYIKDVVDQVSTGDYATDWCFDPNLNFNKENRLKLLGRADSAERLRGMPGFGRYLYAEKSVLVLKVGTDIWSIWIGRPMDVDEYFDNYPVKKYQVNSFSYTQQYGDDGKIIPADEEK